MTMKTMDSSLYLIVEGPTDAAILRTILDCHGFKDVFQIVTGGFNSMSSSARTIRLMKAKEVSRDKILIVFDADSLNPEIKETKESSMRYLSKADYDERIGVFCFVPTIDHYLFGKDFKMVKGDRQEFIKYLQANLGKLRELPEIRRIQEFLDKE